MTAICIQKQHTFSVPVFGVDYIVQISDYLNHRTQEFSTFCRIWLKAEGIEKSVDFDIRKGEFPAKFTKKRMAESIAFRIHEHGTLLRGKE